jgi:uncharacterized iron-regulated protein
MQTVVQEIRMTRPFLCITLASISAPVSVSPSVLISLVTPFMLTACADAFVSPLDAQKLTTAIRSQPVVLLGEVHDNARQHALRARALRGLVEGGARPALLMEQFDREHQTDLDRALSRPGATPDDVIAAGSPGDPAMQGWTWPFYRPYIALALEYRLPVVAANVSRADTRRVLKEGLQALGFDPSIPSDIEATQAQAIVEGHCGMIDAEQAEPLVMAQVARDQFMARSIEQQAPRGAVLLAGNGHVRADVGVPRWMDATTRLHSISIGLLEDGDPNRDAFGVALMTAAQSRPDPCEGMREALPPKR